MQVNENFVELLIKNLEATQAAVNESRETNRLLRKLDEGNISGTISREYRRIAKEPVDYWLTIEEEWLKEYGPILTVSEAAELVNRSPQTIISWANCGKIAKADNIGVLTKSLAAFVKMNKTTTDYREDPIKPRRASPMRRQA